MGQWRQIIKAEGDETPKTDEYQYLLAAAKGLADASQAMGRAVEFMLNEVQSLADDRRATSTPPSGRKRA